MESKRTLLSVFLCTLLVLPVTPATLPCQQTFDVVVMIDGSDSINADDFRLFQNALESLVGELEIGVDKTRMGLVLYSATVTKSVDFSGNSALLRQEIRNLVQPRDGTMTHLALDDAYNMVLRATSRRNVPKIGLVITDGISKFPPQTAASAARLRQEGVDVYAIGVTNNVNAQELVTIASSPSQVKYSSTFSDLTTTLKELLPEICPPTTPMPITTTTPFRIPVVTGRANSTQGQVNSSLCDGCKEDNGIGYLPHPTDCHKFIQCIFDKDGNAEGMIKNCGVGLFWDQEDFTCKYPSDVTCVNDKCNNPGTTHFKSIYNCRQYYSCDDRFGAALCCPQGSSYSDSSRQCVPDNTCNDLCSSAANPVPTAKAQCNKEAVPGQPGFYMEDVPGHGQMKRPCGAGTTFNPINCDCSAFYAANPAPVTSFPPVNNNCSPMLDLQFENDASDSSGKNVWVQNEGVSFRNGWAYFNGDAILRVPRFSNVGLGSTFMVKMRYRADAPIQQQQALFTNRDCGKPGSVGVLLNQGSDTFLMRNEADVEKTVDINVRDQTQWKEVIFRVDGGVLKGTIDGISQEIQVVGDIRRSECALQIGHGNTYENFVGYIDYVQVYKC